jgi:hypothetical protein
VVGLPDPVYGDREILETLPRNPNGKVMKALLRQSA